MNGGYGSAYVSTFTRGEKNYELNNHLGNVLVTVSDKKIQVQNGTTSQVLYYTADVITANDHYPKGIIISAPIFSKNFYSKKEKKRGCLFINYGAND